MVAKNFYFLYRHHKEKQTVLANDFGVTQSTISDYVNGKKEIPTNILNEISKRYGISSDDLMNKDLSIEYDTPQFMFLDDVAEFSDKILPILTSKIARNNNNFNRAYETLISFLQADDIDVFREQIWILKNVVTLFQKAWEESKTYVALSNSVTTILFIYSFYNQKGIEITKELTDKGSLSLLDVQSKYLNNFKDYSEQNLYEKERMKIFKKYKTIVYENIKFLKRNVHFSELGDYYLAICYLFGFEEDFDDYETYAKVSIYMLLQQYEIGNKYAIEFIDNFPKIS